MNQIDTPRILILNGSLRGQHSNTGALCQAAVQYLQTTHKAAATILTLAAPMPATNEVYDLLTAHDALLVTTGIYWNNCSSVLQRFLEVTTAFENTPAYFGKPMGCAVTMDAVGGIEVAARLQAVFGGLGCWNPPCSTVVLSRVGQEAIKATAHQPHDPNEDVWRLDDLYIVLDNLVAATAIKPAAWKAWHHSELKLPAGPWPASGPLDMGSQRFL